MKKNRIGIFGGTFNPIHIGHLRCAEEVKERLGLENIIFVPSFKPPFQKKSLISFEHRLRMVKLGIADNRSFLSSDIELSIPGKSYTIYTVKTLIRRYADNHMYFIMGSDSFLELPKWYEYAQLLEIIDFVVVFRPPLNIIEMIKSPLLKGIETKTLESLSLKKKLSIRPVTGMRKLIFLRTTSLDISATVIRSMLKKGKSVKYLLPQKVESYIISNKLYV